MKEALPALSTVIKQFGLAAKKSLGQHFLLDPYLLQRIVRSAGDLNGQIVMEIGPGPGGLTREILAAGAKKLIAIERDERCIQALESLRAASQDRLEIIAADALTVDEANLLRGQKAKLISNLPYNIGTELLFKWLEKLELFKSLTLMFQKEVADRVSAKPNTKDYGRISIIAQYLADVQHHFDVPPEAFSPPPKVMSSVITLTPKPTDLTLIPALKEICRAGFGQRRKTLRVSLKQLTPEPQMLLDKAGIDGQRRPEDLSIEQFVALAKAFQTL